MATRHGGNVNRRVVVLIWWFQLQYLTVQPFFTWKVRRRPCLSLGVQTNMSNPKPSGSSTDAPPIGRQFPLRSLLLLSVPVALFCLTIWRLLAVLSAIHLAQRDIALSIGIGALVGTLVVSVFWLAGHRLLGISFGIIAWSISIMAYFVFGLGIPIEWIIK